MKKTLILMLTCLLLCGCDAGDNGITNVSSLTPPTERPADIRGLYAPHSKMESQTGGAVTVFPLDLENPYGIRTTQDGILIFSGTHATTLTLLAGENLSVKATFQAEEWISHLDPSLQIHPQYISFYQPSARETVLLHADLREAKRIPDPANLSGIPIYHPGSNILYYCTDTAIYAWALDQNLHRILKELSYTRQELTGVHMDGSILQCLIVDGTREESLFLSTATGKLLHSRDGRIFLDDHNSRYFAAFPMGSATALVFGEPSEEPMALIPKDLYANCTFLEQRNQFLSIASGESDLLQLDLYDLTSGVRISELSMNRQQHPIAVDDSPDGFIYLLCQDPEFNCRTVYRWDSSQSGAADSRNHIAPHHTEKNPDSEGLERCRILAEDIGTKYGISIRIFKDAVKRKPWDYALEEESYVPVLEKALYTLEKQLAQYPESLLQDTASHFSNLCVCLVRQITGSAEAGSLQTAAGIQFTEGTDSYIVLAVGPDLQRTFYHELFHVMDTHLLGNTGAFDRWDQLNPAGFDYDYSYEANKTRNAGVYLQSSTRAFVDTYSMSYPKEDRARIMEYAMLPGNEELFRTPTMQRKLKTLCEGIREAYRLKKNPETYLWEQYLQ